MVLFAVVLVAGVVLSYPVAYKTSATQVEITITDKERVTTGTGQNISSKFLVYAEGEVFQNTDSYLFLKFNSADLQNTLEIGETYVVTVAGWRIPFLSMFRNIISINNDETRS